MGFASGGDRALIPSSRGSPYGRAAAVWLGILLIANINGALREFLLVALLGETLARALSTILLCLLVAILARSTIGWIGPRSANEAWRVGLLWLVLTLAFEFLAGHYIFGDSWEQLLSEYDLASGRIWVIVPLVTLVTPRWAWGRDSARMRGRVALLLAFGTGGSAFAGEPAGSRLDSESPAGGRHIVRAPCGAGASRFAIIEEASLTTRLTWHSRP